MKYLQLASVLIFFAACISPKKISKPNKSVDYDLEFIDYLFKDFDGIGPSASVICIRNGKVELAKSYGYANTAKGILATPATNYRIASVTKQFTATAIMMLVHQGKLSYETSLTEIFSEFPEYGKAITIRQLLTHRSGLVKYNRFIEEGRTEQLLDKDVLNGLLETDSTYFRPGSKYAYSNTGYAVLAQVIEKISGSSFAEFMNREIFRPLEMVNSTILELDKKITNRAYGYVVKDSSVIAKDQSMTSAIQGDGGVYTSVLDYYKWDQALYSDKLLPASELEEAFFSYDENGQTAENGYGYGWMVKYFKGIKVLQHGGSSVGFGSHVVRIPSEKITVAIFTNKNKKGQELSNRARALVNHFSKGKFQMPFELVLEKEIEENGIESGLNLYSKIKTDSISYTITKAALFNFAISYINNNQSDNALKLFEQLTQDYPNYFGGYYGIAIISEKKGNEKKALTNFYKAIEHATERQQWAVKQSKQMIAIINKQKGSN